MYHQWSFNKRLIFVVLYNDLIDCFIARFEHHCKWIIDEISSGSDTRQFGNQKGMSTTH